MTSLATVVRGLLATHHAEWMRNAQAVLRKPTENAVHDMRVAGRKLRAALKPFKKFLPASSKPIDRGLFAIGTLLGTARDLDVHLAYIARGPAGLASYRKDCVEQLRQARREVQEALRATSFYRLNETIEALWKGKLLDAERPANSAAHKLLKKQYRKLRKASKSLKTDSADAKLHRIRRALRRMRYAAQFFEPLGKPALQKIAAKLGKWQDLLGYRQDRLTGGLLVLEYLENQKKPLPLAEEKALLRLVRQMDREKEQFQEQVFLGWSRSQRHKIKRILKSAF